MKHLLEKDHQSGTIRFKKKGIYVSNIALAKKRALIAGNWKMNGLQEALVCLDRLVEGTKDLDVDIAVFPPFTLLPAAQTRLTGSKIRLGAQDCHHEDHGAFTGDISAQMLKDCGVDMVLLGHSERRLGHHEKCSLVAKKVQSALTFGLEPLICIGETLEQRQQGLTREVLLNQLRDSLPDVLETAQFQIAYEPVWAIGTGLTAKDAQIIEAVHVIRDFLGMRFQRHLSPRILYGGSVNPHNARHLLSLEAVGGALVGGASLNATSFLDIVRNVHKSVVN
jgi:triosephosphate isomerase (TIM)